MRGTNPIRPPEAHDGTQLFVQSIFATIQGEGPYSGAPAVFVRLGGCNLACSFCDTEFESFTQRSIFDVLKTVDELARNPARERVRKLVVLTGGEPLRQNIVPLCDALVEHGFTVQLETNGTLFRPIHREVRIVCSPKHTGGGYTPIRKDVLAQCIAIKFLISAQMQGYGDIARVGQENSSGHYTLPGEGIPVFVQPMDEYDLEKNARNVALAKHIALEKGAHISLQLHKLLGVQ